MKSTSTFDLKTSVQKTIPFDLNLSDLIGSGGLADIANALIGLGGSGSLTLNASADLHIALGLQLGQHLDTTGGQHGITLVNNATGGTFTIAYTDTSSALAHGISADDLKTALTGLGLTVTGTPTLVAGVYTVSLGGTVDLTKLSVDGSLLTGGGTMSLDTSGGAAPSSSPIPRRAAPSRSPTPTRPAISVPPSPPPTSRRRWRPSCTWASRRSRSTTAPTRSTSAATRWGRSI